jgi:hypothetical protein
MQQPRDEQRLRGFAKMLSRRELLQRAGALGLGALVTSALPAAGHIFVSEAAAAVQLTDATLQAFADTMLPGRRALVTDLGNEIHPLAIAGVDEEPGTVEADALLLYRDALIGFDALEAPFLAELSTRSLVHGGPFLDLGFEQRVAVCLEGLAPSNPSVQVWEAAAAIAFVAFLAAGAQGDATIETSSAYQVMGYPGTAPNGYAEFSYRRKLATELTSRGYLP